jgi:subtilisin family serine protease
MGPRFLVKSLFTIVTASGLILTLTAQTDAPMERVLIHTAKPYAGVVSRIQAAGGRVRHQFKYVDAIAADVPRAAVPALRSLAGVDEVSKDITVPAPQGLQPDRADDLLVRNGAMRAIESSSVTSIAGASLPGFAAAYPDAYLINNANMNVTPLLASGITGAGVIVAVVDSGIRPGFPHLTLDNSVIGGEDLVGDGLGFSNNANNGHGTFVAGMISANVLFSFDAGGTFARSVVAHCPTCTVPPPAPGFTAIPMLGSAPQASIYGLRVFGPAGGSPTSRIIAAIERVIELREMFDAGLAGGVNIQVCNMSIGGPTLFAGRDLLDTAASMLLSKGVVLTVSASNAGPSSLTLGSPGSAFEALTAGASSDAIHERIVRDLQFGLGIGALYRPFGGTQTAFFSSRGPTADGRTAPDVVANGDWSFGQGFSGPTAVNFAGGTSFSAPTAAGIAALLRQAFPSATARQIRNAIIMGANPHVLADDSTVLDQGEGYVDAKAAYDLLAAHKVHGSFGKPRRPGSSVAKNVKRGTALDPLRGTVVDRVADLKPGERADYLYQVDDDTAQVTLQLIDVTPGAIQNALFDDDILFAAHSAKTSAIGEGDYVVGPLFTRDRTFVINDPEPGLLRLTALGDWTNASPIALDVRISSTKRREPRRVTARSFIRQDQQFTYDVTIPSGAAEAVFQVRWRGNWSHYPTSDIDLYAIDPGGSVNVDGATLDSPEEVTIVNPAAGTWTFVVDGFDVPGWFDIFELRVIVDGKVVRIW